MTIRIISGPERIKGDALELAPLERSRYRVAALHARRLYPGSVGELISCELKAYADFGYQVHEDGLIPRVATAVLATHKEGVGVRLPSSWWAASEVF